MVKHAASNDAEHFGSISRITFLYSLVQVLSTSLFVDLSLHRLTFISHILCDLITTFSMALI